MYERINPFIKFEGTRETRHLFWLIHSELPSFIFQGCSWFVLAAPLPEGGEDVGGGEGGQGEWQGEVEG